MTAEGIAQETPDPSDGRSPESHYLDDDLYARLRHDLVEWDRRGQVLTQHEREVYESLILHENWLLDRRRFEDWFELYSSECVYWVPQATDMPDPEAGDPQTHVTIAFDDRRRLGDRIAWLATGLAFSQVPPTHTSHTSSGFVRVPTDDDTEFKIRSNFVVSEFRDGRPGRTVAGWAGHVFVTERNETRIARKIVCILDGHRAQHNLSYLL